MNRRKFLQVSTASSILSFLTGAPFADALSPALPLSASIPIYKVIFDARFAQSLLFAQHAQQSGLPVHAIRGDVTALWFHDLDIRWRESPVAISGMTAPNSLFCLERLAWDHGMRVIVRAEHQVAGNEHGDRLVSWVIAPVRRI